MKNLFRKTIKLVSVLTVLSVVVIALVYSFKVSVDAKQITSDVRMVTLTDNTQKMETETTEAVTEEVTEAETESATEETIAFETETTVEETTVVETETTIEETTVEETTEVETEVVTTEAVTETEAVTTVEETTQEQTQAPQVEAEVQVSVPSVSYTNVVFKDAYNTYKFNTLEEAKASLNIATLTDEQANAKAIENKSNFASQAEEVLRRINEYRAANGVGTVVYDDTIATAAMHRAAESAYADWNMTAYENGTTKRHIRPNFQKASSIRDYYGLAGNFGENFGRYQESPAEIMEGWMNSASHNSLMLNGSYTRCGIGVAMDCDGYYYWVAIFM